ncbi:MAG: 30S ribosomal protein S3 [Thermoplasmata archaeon]|nr:MAG: 30S ribosomal protein S3 [Thermoplasmata archaeon]RLF36771.1 MAG: 30S ribosomal protein S3 [Thermoplasmata archaeon]
MSSERKFIRENTKRSLIKKFLLKEIEGAGFGGMTIQRTPIGTRINILVERPGMVIGKGGNKIKELTEIIQKKFDVDNPQIEIQEAGASAPLNAQIMAEKLAEALERGWHFRRAGHSTVRRIMNAGAKGCQVIIAGKLTGARHRTEKFTEGHVKYCGEIAKEVMDEGFAVAKLKSGVLGVKVRIMKPDAKLPDEIRLKTLEEKEPEPKTEETKTREEPEKKTDIKKLAEIPGVGPSVIKKFEKAGIKSLEELYTMSIDDIVSIEGIGKKTAETVIKRLKKLIEEAKKDES